MLGHHAPRETLSRKVDITPQGRHHPPSRISPPQGDADVVSKMKNERKIVQERCTCRVKCNQYCHVGAHACKKFHVGAHACNQHCHVGALKNALSVPMHATSATLVGWGDSEGGLLVRRLRLSVEENPGWLS
eukprot:353893-Chlamydomonas_euryale.AAC.13